MGMYGGGDTVIQAPAAPTYQESTRDILKTQIEMADDLFAAEAKNQPRYNKLEAEQQAFLAQEGINMARTAYPQIAEIEAAYSRANRAAELSQIQSDLPQYQQAINALTPGYAQAIGSMGQLAQQAALKANQPVQLTNFESQVGSPYGPAQTLPLQAQQTAAAQQPAPHAGRAAAEALKAKQAQLKTKLDTARATQAQTQVDRAASRQSIVDAQKARGAEVMANIQAARDGTAPMVSAAGGPAMPGISTGQMQGPVEPSIARPAPQFADPERILSAQGQAPTTEQMAAYQQAFQGQQQAMQAQGATQRPSAMQGPGMPLQSQIQQQFTGQQQATAGQPYSGLQNAVAGQYAAAVPQFQATAPIDQLGQTAAQAAAQAGTVPDAVNMQGVQSAFDAAKTAGEVPGAVNLKAIVGPQLQSGLENLNRGTVDQYVAAMPGMADYAQRLSQISQQELAAGRNLSAEEQRMADQVARSAYAARGTALGPQAVGAEILNRADVQNQRFQERLGTAQRAAGQIQSIYQPALQQSYDRQLSGLQYGLTAQQQAFGQAQNRDAMEQALQAQRYSQAMGTQTTGFGQAQAKDSMAAAIQAQRYGQAMGTQGAGFNQLLGQENFLQGAQQQAYQQAMGREELRAATQGTAFNQALQRSQAEQQRLQGETAIQASRAQLSSGALGQLQAAQAPVLQAFYKQPILQGQQGQSQQMALAMQQQSGPQLFNPESQVGMGSIYGAYNSQMGLAAAQAQANAATQAAKYGMIGNLVGAAGTLGAGIAKCWVAREVYGEHNPTWKIFREWLIEDAPKWFHDLYCKYGERFAKFISNKPKLKQLVKAWMDSRIS